MRGEGTCGGQLRPQRLAVATLLLLVLAGRAHAQLVNQATVQDPYYQHSARVISTVVSSADLAINKTAPPGPIAAGAPLTYSISVTNNGPSAATDVVVSDPLPAAVTFLATTPSAGGSCTTPAVGSTGTVTCTWSGATQPAEIRSVGIDVQTPVTRHALTLINTATASSQTSDPTAGNDSSSATVTAVVQLPTLGWPGGVLLALALAVAGWVAGRRLLTGA